VHGPAFKSGPQRWEGGSPGQTPNEGRKAMYYCAKLSQKRLVKYLERSGLRHSYFQSSLFHAATRIVTLDVSGAGRDIAAQRLGLATATRTLYLHLGPARPAVTAARCRMTRHSTCVTARQLAFTAKHSRITSNRS